jgi:pyrimidine operon attenuation protein/uracil phosphoribosyltransferase
LIGNQGHETREGTIIGRMANIENFDFIGIKNKNHPLFEKLNRVMSKYDENQHCPYVFTDFVYQISYDLKRNKRLLVITEETIYCLDRDSLATKQRISL